MRTLNAIIKELKDLPPNRLEELYQYVHALNPKKKMDKEIREKIMSFAGSFSDMTDKDYQEFIKENKKSRENLFGRNIEI